MKYFLFLIQEGTENKDTQNDLSIMVESDRTVNFLSDFIGGRATLTEGYTGYMTDYSVQICDFDSCRLHLCPDDKDKYLVTVNPCFKRLPDNTLEALPLQANQSLNLNFGNGGLSLNYKIQSFRQAHN
ncbi:hypothetical protein HCY58_03495 [Acinetobacter radioresistens]|uniref:hypothetical protein n=1 Tax=Acinetobacter radioresistens TaxID=40216 RepID=UPI002002DF8F|nr:hypothetical protein [Acinetobacter radioresistens]MCK4086129.1 hypothetical protein [Acinetobacter radioresistens]